MSSKIYQLSHTGPEVDEAIAKIKDLDLDEVNGGITELTSSATNPFNINVLVGSGIYKAAFVDPITCPEGADKIHPVYISVQTEDRGDGTSIISHVVTAGPYKWYHTSTDGGLNWSEWEDIGVKNAIKEMSREDVDSAYQAVFSPAATTSLNFSRLKSSMASKLSN